MDRTDILILNILQEDCRTTLKAVGDQVGLTPPAVSERIRRLEEKGVIRAFTVDIDREKLGCGMSGFILASVPPEKYSAFCSFCREQPAVTAHHRVIGVFNALLRFSVAGTSQLEELLTAIKQYGDSQTSVELKTFFERRDIPLPDVP